MGGGGADNNWNGPLLSLSMAISDEIEDTTIAVDEPKIWEIEATI